MKTEVIRMEGAKVLMLSPEGTPRRLVEEEAEHTRLAMDLGMEVPFVHGVEERDGRIGLVMDEIIGPNYLEWMLRTPSAWEKLARFFAYEHHEIHMHRAPELPSLKSKLRQAISKARASDDLRAKALSSLESLPDSDGVCHGSYHPHNVIVSLDGTKVMDWSAASKGFYLGDVARTCLLLEISSLRSEGEGLSDDAANMMEKLRAGYRFEYLKICGKGEEDLREWMFPVAVARLGEGVPGEEHHLMRIIEESLR